ncbi:hypothetical protein [uncultured Paraglaciecola sp.]|uniref:hypothetical protein n=1 Tax=uncultured Paraglaciecola sp. TaxID=1765024 RepID=UPI0025E45C56|nr:hypothetical protein [uncultured Paraglaciecola sp.]
MGYGHFNIRHDGLFNFIESTPGANDSHTELAVYQGTEKWINRTAFNRLVQSKS